MRKNLPRSAFAAGGDAQREPIVIVATVHSNDGYVLTRTRFVKLNQTTVIAAGAHPHLSLRGAQRRGNLVEDVHTPAHHHCYGDEIAAPVSSTG